MSKSPSSSSRSGRTAPPTEQQHLIAEQTAAFLEKGNHIQVIPRGVSGQPKLGGPQLKSTTGTSPARKAPQDDAL